MPTSIFSTNRHAPQAPTGRDHLDCVHKRTLEYVSSPSRETIGRNRKPSEGKMRHAHENGEALGHGYHLYYLAPDMKRSSGQRAASSAASACRSFSCSFSGFGLTLLSTARNRRQLYPVLVPGMVSMSVMFTSVFSASRSSGTNSFGFLKETLVPESRAWNHAGQTAGGATTAVLQGSSSLSSRSLSGSGFQG